jgi:hypothetical protein
MSAEKLWNCGESSWVRYWIGYVHVRPLFWSGMRMALHRYAVFAGYWRRYDRGCRVRYAICTSSQAGLHRVMQDIIGSNQFVYEAYVAFVPNLIKSALGENLVVF